MKKQPWYKRIVIWLLVTGAAVVGACLVFNGKMKQAARRMPVISNKRKAEIKKIEREIHDIDSQIEELEHVQKQIPDSDTKSIADINTDLAKARELRRAKREADDRG